jgi:hypothetical protein
VLVATIGLPPPHFLGDNIYVAWIHRPPLPPIPIQLLQTGPVIIEPGVWVGAIIFGPDEQFAPFQDIMVTAEIAFPVLEPNLSRIALIGLFELCRPQQGTQYMGRWVNRPPHQRSYDRHTVYKQSSAL